jgi:hypothetical protein
MEAVDSTESLLVDFPIQYPKERCPKFPPPTRTSHSYITMRNTRRQNFRLSVVTLVTAVCTLAVTKFISVRDSFRVNEKKYFEASHLHKGPTV